MLPLHGPLGVDVLDYVEAPHVALGGVALGLEYDLEVDLDAVEALLDDDLGSHDDVGLHLKYDAHAYHDDDGVLEASHEGGDSLEDLGLVHDDDDLGDAHYGCGALHSVR